MEVILTKQKLLLGLLLITLFIVILGLLAGLLKPSCTERNDQEITSNDEDESDNGEPVPEEVDLINEPWKHHRLPENLLAESYNLTLFPDFYANSTSFSGNVSVIIFNNDTESARFIMIHIKRLRIASTKLTHYDSNAANDEYLEISRNFSYTENEYWVVEPREPLAPRARVVLTMSFEGSLVEGIVGLYRSSYVDSRTGEKKYLVTSKFQPTDARKAFPCFDEPSFKSTFNVTIIHRPDYNALSNMPLIREPEDIGDGFVASHFQSSPVMVTYLACFIVSDFLYLENVTRDGIPFRVYAPPDRIEQSVYSLDVGVKVLEGFTDYFNTSYPLPKLDMISIPDFVSGAMEHWGIITYRDTNMLYDPSGASATNKRRVATVVAHELAHMWFGNLVTMKWWDDLWLNEGFASFMEYKGVELVHPDWDIMDQFVNLDVQPVMITDAKLSSHPIVVPVSHPDEITEVFDSISYSKGSSVIRMLETFMEPRYFQEGIRAYIKHYLYKHTVTADLWSWLNKFAGEGMPPVNDVMDTWTRQMGFPVVRVQFNGREVQWTQERFLLNPQTNITDSSSPYNYLWKIPLTYITSSGRTNVRQTDISWLTAREGSFTLPFGLENDLIKFNVNQTGFYRVDYPTEHWNKFVDALLQDSQILGTSDRANLIDDVFSLSRAGLRPYTDALNLIRYMRAENHPVPWQTFQRSTKYMRNMMKSSIHYGLWKTFIGQLAGPVLRRIGFDGDDGFQNRLLRSTLINIACGHGETFCLNSMARLFSQWINGTEIPVDIRSAVYRYGMMQSGDAETWDLMWSRYDAAVVPQEKSRLLVALTCTRSIWLLKRLLEYTKDENKIRSQNFFYVVAYIGINEVGNYVVWDWIRDNWQYIVSRFGTNNRYLGRIVPNIASRFNSEFKLRQIRDFFATYRKVGAGARAAKQAVETIQSNIAWMNTNENAIAEWLDTTIN